MLKHAYYHAPVQDFINAGHEAILGELVQSHSFALEQSQRDAWIAEISVMKSALKSVPAGFILFEFYVPRMGKRADVVLLIGRTVLVLEFKVGALTFDRSAIEQAHDYALDLRNFHRGSHALSIVPVVIATSGADQAHRPIEFADDAVAIPILVAPEQLSELITRACPLDDAPETDFDDWLSSGYQPTPSIIEAAQSLYQAHGVQEIARSDAGAINLGITTDCINEIIENAKANGRKAICLVTGVPGAGKTLAGLNVATRRQQQHSSEHAVFLSGNGPLVAVLREALARDESRRTKCKKTVALRKVSSFVQNIHHFRDEVLKNPNPPFEKVVIYDEAQRAWTKEQASKFMLSKRGVRDFGMSEPEFLLSAMDRHNDWCVIICLIGGGQEINTGEAGLSEWLSAIAGRFSHWNAFISSKLSERDYLSSDVAIRDLSAIQAVGRDELHLSVSMRSFRAETLSSLIGHIVDNRPEEARAQHDSLVDRYPIYLTRDIGDARRWLKKMARGSERYGLLASSGGLRLKPDGIHVKSKVDASTWFLNDRTDVRSSYYCEEVGTEFDVQGLELDWAGICWDADFRYQLSEFGYFRFRGASWEGTRAADRRMYLRNAYRVILTRARQGMVIFVPRGSTEDPSRPPEYYDQTYEYLKSCGLRDLVV
jgi:hypothetical protein